MAFYLSGTYASLERKSEGRFTGLGGERHSYCCEIALIVRNCRIKVGFVTQTVRLDLSSCKTPHRTVVREVQLFVFGLKGKGEGGVQNNVRHFNLPIADAKVGDANASVSLEQKARLGRRAFCFQGGGTARACS